MLRCIEQESDGDECDGARRRIGVGESVENREQVVEIVGVGLSGRKGLIGHLVDKEKDRGGDGVEICVGERGGRVKILDTVEVVFRVMIDDEVEERERLQEVLFDACLWTTDAIQNIGADAEMTRENLNDHTVFGIIGGMKDKTGSRKEHGRGDKKKEWRKGRWNRRKCRETSMDDKDFGDRLIVALSIGGEDEIGARSDTGATIGTTGPDSLTAQGLRREDHMASGIGDMDVGIAGKALDGDRAVIVGADRVGEGMDLIIVERQDRGIGGRRAIRVESEIGAHEEFA